MTDGLYNIYADKLLSKTVSFSETDESICCASRGHFPKKYIQQEDFFNVTLQYIKSKMNSDNLTDVNNNINIYDTYNCIYIDLDYYLAYDDNDNYDDYNDFCNACSSIATCYIDAITKVLTNKNLPFYYFAFIPSMLSLDDVDPEVEENKLGEDCSVKSGAHVMIFLSRNIDVNTRKEIYNEMIRFVKPRDLCLNVHIKDTVLTEVVDYGAFMRTSILLPFAQKDKTSRKYIHMSSSYQKQDWFVIEHTHAGEITDVYIQTQPILKDDDIPEEYKTIINDILGGKEYDMEFETLKLCGDCGVLVVRFLQSLYYLEDRHIFWKILTVHGDRLYTVMTPYIRYMYLLHIVVMAGNVKDDAFMNEMPKITTIVFKKLLDYVSIGVDTERNTMKSILEKATYLCKKVCSSKWYTAPFLQNVSKSHPVKKNNSDNSNEEEYGDDENTGEMAPDPDLDTDGRWDLLKFFGRQFGKISTNSKKKMPVYDNIKLIYFQKQCQITISGWNSFVNNIIMKGFTTEIEPFDERKSSSDNPRKHKLDFDDVITCSSSYNEYKVFMDRLHPNVYENTMIIWSQMFLFVSLYESTQLMDSIREVINTFIKWYITVCEYDKNDLLIYNVKQTTMMAQYPYNQWIPNENDMLKRWVVLLYHKFIRPLLQTSQRRGGLDLFCKTLLTDIGLNNIITPVFLKPLDNIGNSIGTIVQNTIMTYQLDMDKQPSYKPIETCQYFPMRSCILEFKMDGTYDVCTDNREIYLGSYTNVMYVDDYNYKCEAYNDVKTMISRIYPDKSDLDYNMTLFASVLHGLGLKDMLHILYGTGGDGKTTIINALLALLGAPGFGTDIKTIENGKQITLKNPRGLASVGKSETLLVSAKPSSHDEGGKKEMTHVRLCNIQEPDTNINGGKLNGNIVKDVTSGTITQTRGIYSKSESSQINCLITYQTNKLPETDDITEGFKRRLSVYAHRSKFITNDSLKDSQYKNVPNIYAADSKLANNIINNPDYWQAMFYILLPYAVKTLQSGWLPLSRIPKTQSVSNMVHSLIRQSSGLLGWLAQYMIYNDDDNVFDVINIRSLVTYLIDINQTVGFMNDRMKQSDKQRTVEGILQNTYAGYIYKLKDKYYSKSGRSCTITKEVVKQNELLCRVQKDSSITCNRKDFMETYLEKNAKTSFEDSLVANKDDLYLINHVCHSKC